MKLKLWICIYFYLPGSEKSARGISKFEIAAAGPSHCEAAKKCTAVRGGRSRVSPSTILRHGGVFYPRGGTHEAEAIRRGRLVGPD